MLHQLYIDWTVSSQLIDGWNTPNLYGLLFVSGIIIGYFVIKQMFKAEGDKFNEKDLDLLLLYTVIPTIIGARLGHVFFYDWEYYSKNPQDIIKVWEGGLASHGAAIMILLSLFFYSKYVVKKPWLWVLDRVVIPITIAGCFIRLGNLVNHEIIGKPTTLPWGFIFHYSPEAINPITGEIVPRHPAQLYEAIYYLGTFFLLLFLYWKKQWRNKQGAIFGLFMIVLWSGRFFIEFMKDAQTERDVTSVLSTGQWLSIPFVLIGIYILYNSFKSTKTSSKI